MWFRHLFDGKVGLYIQMLQNLDLNEIITTNRKITYILV